MSSWISEFVKSVQALNHAVLVTSQRSPRTGSPQGWDSFKGQAGNLTWGSTIATFLASVQANIIALSYQDNSTSLKRATNAFGFVGVTLDVLAACFGLMAASGLERRISAVETQVKAIDHASIAKLEDAKKFLTERENRRAHEDILPLFGDANDFTDLLISVATKCRDRAEVLAKGTTESEQPARAAIVGQLPGVLQMPRLLHEIQASAVIGKASTVALILGIICFFLSVLLLAASTQPRAVWIAVTV
ncbi:hypothetical protein FB45DRAFT_1051157 [Roridomyces roridus]|uniref:Uncharacterized protein n=1 Tax=Roridomyces roridus TaxID=1738132 RepID=A0AAD7G3H1_9AGAR|nr:hypothetical protein FB45DRAFT_1051157 [Roridomyces roridus]